MKKKTTPNEPLAEAAATAANAPAPRRGGKAPKNAQPKKSKTEKAPARQAGAKKAPKRAPKQTKPARTKAAATRDPRLPAVGSTLTRTFKGKEIVVQVVEGGFEYEGQTFKSISAVAKHIVGYMISGPVFFRLAEPKPAAKEE